MPSLGVPELLEVLMVYTGPPTRVGAVAGICSAMLPGFLGLVVVRALPFANRQGLLV